MPSEYFVFYVPDKLQLAQYYIVLKNPAYVIVNSYVVMMTLEYFLLVYLLMILGAINIEKYTEMSKPILKMKGGSTRLKFIHATVLLKRRDKQM